MPCPGQESRRTVLQGGRGQVRRRLRRARQAGEEGQKRGQRRLGRNSNASEQCPRCRPQGAGGVDPCRQVSVAANEDLVQALTRGAEERPEAIELVRRTHVRPCQPMIEDTAEAARRVELERGLRLLERGIAPAQVFEDMSRRLTSKLLHAPTK